MERVKTPERMVDDGRFVCFGKFTEPFREINMLDAEIKLGGRRAGRLLKNFRLKEWEHFGLITEHYYFGVLLIDAKYLGNAFFYVFDRKNRDFFEHSRISLGAPLRISRELWHSECYIHHLGFFMQFENRLDAGYHRIQVEIARSKGKPEISADVKLFEDLNRIEPLVVLSPIGEDRALYTHKTICPAAGNIRVGEDEIQLDHGEDIGLMDVQKTYYPFNTFWKWATFGWHDAEGRLIGLNLCDNFIEDDERYNENCVWVDGKITPLSAAHFEYDEKNLMKPWRLYTTNGEVDLMFKPLGERRGKINLGILVSDFHQPFGEFEGKIKGASGEEVAVEKAFGVCEHHVARF